MKPHYVCIHYVFRLPRGTCRLAATKRRGAGVPGRPPPPPPPRGYSDLFCDYFSSRIPGSAQCILVYYTIVRVFKRTASFLFRPSLLLLGRIERVDDEAETGEARNGGGEGAAWRTAISWDMNTLPVRILACGRARDCLPLHPHC